MRHEVVPEELRLRSQGQHAEDERCEEIERKTGVPSVGPCPRGAQDDRKRPEEHSLCDDVRQTADRDSYTKRRDLPGPDGGERDHGQRQRQTPDPDSVPDDPETDRFEPTRPPPHVPQRGDGEQRNRQAGKQLALGPVQANGEVPDERVDRPAQ